MDHGIHNFRRCPSCGFDILADADVRFCPRCGETIQTAAVFDGDDAGALRKVRRSLIIAFWSLVIGTASGVVIGFTIGALSGVMSGSRQQMSQRASHIVEIAMSAAGMVFTIVLLILWWGITTPVPGVDPHRDAPRARNSIRFLYLLTLILAGVALVNAIVNPTNVYQPPQGQAPNWAQLFPPHLIVMWIVNFMVSSALLWSQALYMSWLGMTFTGAGNESLFGVSRWLVPLLVTVGFAACGMGPTAALVLIVIMMYKVAAALRDTPVHGSVQPPSDHATYQDM